MSRERSKSHGKNNEGIKLKKQIKVNQVKPKKKIYYADFVNVTSHISNIF